MKRYCLTLDLVDDPTLIRAYEEHHRRVWPEVEESLRRAGIRVMEIWRTGNRLFMIMETDPEFSFGKKRAVDESIAAVAEWEELMDRYQKRLPGSDPGEKWQLMDCIYRFES